MMAVDLLPSSARYFNVCRVGTLAVAAVLASQQLVACCGQSPLGQPERDRGCALW